MSAIKTKQALFAAGCFWGLQFYFDQIPGVIKTVVGYTGGHTKNPTYEQVCSHATGHAEAVLISFDPRQVSYETLLVHFFRIHDPTQLNRQGPDIGDNYRSAIFYFNAPQKEQAEGYIRKISSTYKGKVVTEVTLASTFYEAEEYHQKFAERTGKGTCSVEYSPVDQ